MAKEKSLDQKIAEGIAKALAAQAKKEKSKTIKNKAKSKPKGNPTRATTSKKRQRDEDEDDDDDDEDEDDELLSDDTDDDGDDDSDDEDDDDDDEVDWLKDDSSMSTILPQGWTDEATFINNLSAVRARLPGHNDHIKTELDFLQKVLGATITERSKAGYRGSKPPASAMMLVVRLILVLFKAKFSQEWHASIESQLNIKLSDSPVKTRWRTEVLGAAIRKVEHYINSEIAKKKKSAAATNTTKTHPPKGGRKSGK